MPRQRQAPQFTPEQRDQIQAGLTTLKNGDIEGAREIYINLLEADPELAAGHVGLGRVFAAEGDYVRALEHFEEAVAIQPDFTRAYMMSADAHEQIGEIDAAVADIDAAIRSDPTKGYSYIKKAQLLQRHDRLEEGRAAIEEGVKRNPQDPRLRTILANTLGRQGDTEAKLREYRRAIELQPDNWFTHFSLGTALLREREFAEARDSLNRAAELAPDKTHVHQALGYALSELGDHVSAGLAYEAALLIDPRDLRAILGAARTKNAIGQHEQALEILLSSGRKGTRFAPIQRALGNTYRALGREDEAIEVFRAVVLNTAEFQKSAPELVALANEGPGEDKADYAARLQQMLTTAFDLRHAETEQARRPAGGPRNRNPRGGRGPRGAGGRPGVLDQRRGPVEAG